MSQPRLICTALLVCVPGTVLAGEITVTGETTTAVHTAAGDGVTLGSGDYYGTGNDDPFAEFGITTFRASVPGIQSVWPYADLSLAVTKRHPADNKFEFFFTPDSADDLGGNFADLSYNPALENGLDASQFVTAPVSLGVIECCGHPFIWDGLVVNFGGLNFVPVQDQLLSALSTGADFQIIVAAVAATDEATFYGVGNSFDPVTPTLTLTVFVPEPASCVLLNLAGLVWLSSVRQRRRQR